MNGRARALGKLFGGFDCAFRHGREIDRNENVLKIVSFHGFRLTRTSSSGSPLLAKSIAFFAQPSGGLFDKRGLRFSAALGSKTFQELAGSARDRRNVLFGNGSTIGWE